MFQESYHGKCLSRCLGKNVNGYCNTVGPIKECVGLLWQIAKCIITFWYNIAGAISAFYLGDGLRYLVVLRYYCPNLSYQILKGLSGFFKSHMFLAMPSVWLEPSFLGFTDRGLCEEACFREGSRRK